MPPQVAGCPLCPQPRTVVQSCHGASKDMIPIYEAFVGNSDPTTRWQTHVVGSGQLETTRSSLRLVTGQAVSGSYTNAQIDDYQGLPRHRFAWNPPLRLTVRARFSHGAEELRGTAGFGFWNDPLLMTQRRLPTLPSALWFFFASAPSDMKLDIDTPGNGWKAASIDARRATALVWAPLAPLVVPLMNFPMLYQHIWPHIQRDLRIRETVLRVDMTCWHTYELLWGTERSQFRVFGEDAESGHPLLTAPSPRGPLGFVMWQDNQYLAVRPWGHIKWGLLDVPGQQWMEVETLEIVPLQNGESRFQE